MSEARKESQRRRRSINKTLNEIYRWIPGRGERKGKGEGRATVVIAIIKKNSEKIMLEGIVGA
jgi:hypothetical protein